MGFGVWGLGLGAWGLGLGAWGLGGFRFQGFGALDFGRMESLGALPISQTFQDMIFIAHGKRVHNNKRFWRVGSWCRVRWLPDCFDVSVSSGLGGWGGGGAGVGVLGGILRALGA